VPTTSARLIHGPSAGPSALSTACCGSVTTCRVWTGPAAQAID
jgi:hypothetical protein